METVRRRGLGYRHVALAVACDDDRGEEVGHRGAGREDGEAHDDVGNEADVPEDLRPAHLGGVRVRVRDGVRVRVRVRVSLTLLTLNPNPNQGR